MMRAMIATATAVFVIASSTVKADTGVPTSIFVGGGCFNFVMNGVQYSQPYVGVGGATVPRGGQPVMDAWNNLIITVPHGTVTFTRTDPINPDVCDLGGFGYNSVSSP
jgi:hypothetical protein